jgi:hypothetical protein
MFFGPATHHSPVTQMNILPEMVAMPHFGLTFQSLFQATQGVLLS